MDFTLGVVWVMRWEGTALGHLGISHLRAMF